MDSLVRIPGINWRIGLDPILGLVPGIGDLLSAAISLYILFAAVAYGAPKITLLRMGMNIAIDLFVGAIPILGDVFDIVWKANERNVALLRSRTRAYGPVARRAQLSDWVFVALVLAVLAAVFLFAVAVIWIVVGQIMALLHG